MGIRVRLVADKRIEVVADDIQSFIEHFSPRLSREGVLIESDDELPRGRELELSLGLAEGLVLVRGIAMVDWRRRARPSAGLPQAYGLHMLGLVEGTDFVERLEREQQEAGKSAFSLEEAKPVSEDGSPLEGEAIHRMMSTREERPPTEGISGQAHSNFEDVDDDSRPDFAPGFGKAQNWNREVQAPMSERISGWLGEQDDADSGAPTSTRAPELPRPGEQLGPPLQDEGTAARPQALPRAFTETPREKPREKPAETSAETSTGTPTGTRKETPPPNRTPPPLSERPPELPGISAAGEQREQREQREAQDPTPDAEEAAPTGDGASASGHDLEAEREAGRAGGGRPSFVETSRRASERWESESRLQTPPPQAPSAFATIAVRPEDIEKLVRGAGPEDGPSSTPGPGAASADGPREGAASTSSPSSASISGRKASPAPRPASAPSPVRERPDGPSPSAGRPSSAAPAAAATRKSEPGGAGPVPPPVAGPSPSYEMPSEDRTPMIVVGVIVGVIVVALALWVALS